MQTKYLKKLKIIISSAFDSLADIGNFKAFYDKYLPQIVAKQWDGENLISITINCQADEFNSFCEQLSIATGLDQFEIVVNMTDDIESAKYHIKLVQAKVTAKLLTDKLDYCD